jgi:hypothetical protein
MNPTWTEFFWFSFTLFFIGIELSWVLFGAENSPGAQKRLREASQLQRFNTADQLFQLLNTERKVYEKTYSSSKVADLMPRDQAEAYFRGIQRAWSTVIDSTITTERDE